VRSRGVAHPARPADPRPALSAWLRLLRAHGLLLRQVRRRLPEGFTLPQFDVLAQLARRPEGATPKELAGELLVTAGNLTGIVERLVRAGLVERRRDAGDGRVRRLRLTPAGRRRMARVLPQHAREVAALFGHLEPAELERLRALLGDLARGLAEQESAA
jgi:DNA-binding MarR family transcriptional regulator